MKTILLIVCFAIGETTSARLERSLGGKPISIQRASFFVSIKKNDLHKCGGALITQRHVLTAATCVLDDRDARDYENEVVVGTDEKYEGGTRHKIERIRLVEGGFNREFDLAVLELSDDATRNYTIRPLPIGQPTFYGNAYLYAFESSFDIKKNTRLQKLGFLLFSNGQYGRGVDEQIPRIFVGVGEQDSVFRRDAGGPIVQKKRLVGIASSVQSRAGANPVFIWVHKFGSHLKQLVPGVKILP